MTTSSWDEIAAGLKDLGRQVRARYRERTAQAEEGTPRAEAADTADTGGAGEAIQQMIDRLDQAFTSLGDAVRDPDFRRQAGRTAESFGKALAATLADVGESLQQAFRGGSSGAERDNEGDGESAPSGAADPAAGDAAPPPADPAAGDEDTPPPPQS